MENRWDDDIAARCAGELALRAYSSRLLGAEPSLVLLGGGNTSLKLRNGEGQDVLYVKGTGVDLAHATASDFTPLRLQPVRAMLQKSDLDYASMMRELADYTLTADAPRPSIETLLHAALPAPYVEHTHADSILAITNTEGGMELAEKIFGSLALVVPYRHSGFALAKICAKAWAERASADTIGIVLMHHGVVACGASAHESYVNMLRLVELAETYLASHGAGALPQAPAREFDRAAAIALATLRRDISRVAGYPLLFQRLDDPEVDAFARDPAMREASMQSPATPQHAVFARRIPMRGRDVAGYARDYAQYLRLLPEGNERLDAAPRIVLDEQLGVLAGGITPWHMDAAAASYRHTVTTMIRASAHDQYRGLPPVAVLEAELEYGGFEHRIARERSGNGALAGSVALIAPALAEFVSAITETALAAGGAVTVFGHAGPGGAVEPGFLPMAEFDAMTMESELDTAVKRFGGIDAVVCTPSDTPLIERALPWLKLSPRPARVVLVRAAAADDGTASARLTAAGIAFTELDAHAFFSPVQLAQAAVAALALRATTSFPVFN